jgi:hypothetical protein
MPKRKVPAKSPARRPQRRLSEWKLLGRYLRQMTGHDLDNYARLIAVLKDRFARMDDRRGYDPADEYEARRYGPNHLAREIMMQ